MARAMLADLLVQLGTAEDLDGVRKLLVYAPADAKDGIAKLLARYGVQNDWEIEPMLEDAESGAQLESNDLGDKLAHALLSAQRERPDDPVAFIGMDTPDMPAHIIRRGLDVARGGDGSTEAYITPASDGGYTLLVVPAKCSTSAFQGIEWSSSMTCSSQVIY